MTVQLRTLEETRIEKPSVRAKPKLGHTRASAFALVFVDASNVRTGSSRVINAMMPTIFHTIIVSLKSSAASAAQVLN